MLLEGVLSLRLLDICVVRRGWNDQLHRSSRKEVWYMLTLRGCRASPTEAVQSLGLVVGRRRGEGLSSRAVSLRLPLTAIPLTEGTSITA